MDSEDLEDLERRLRQVMAVAIRKWAVEDTGWDRFRSAIAQTYASDVLVQNGMSSSGSIDSDDGTF